MCGCAVASVRECLTLCGPRTIYRLQSSSVHLIHQARILEWVAMPSSRASSQLRDWTQISNASGFLTTEPPGKPLLFYDWWCIEIWELPSETIYLFILNKMRVERMITLITGTVTHSKSHSFDENQVETNHSKALYIMASISENPLVGKLLQIPFR